MATQRTNVQKELAELRAQVAALEAAQAKQATEAPPAAAEPSLAAATAADAAPAESGLTERFEELFEMLDQDIRDTPTTSCLVIFGLGLILGRVLAA